MPHASIVARKGKIRDIMTVDVASRVLPMNEFLFGLHGPAISIADTMRQLVYFPDLATPDDATVLDLRVAVTAETGDPSQVSVTVRFSTALRRCEIVELYVDQLGERGVLAANPNATSGEAMIAALLEDDYGTRLQLFVDDFPGYRTIRAIADYQDLDHHELFARFADWHSGTAPVAASIPPSGIEINTFASGLGPNALVLYSTRYTTETSRADRRALVGSQILDRGWSYHEPREGIMFIRDGDFEAETHIDGDHQRSSVTFVGEFQLR